MCEDDNNLKIRYLRDMGIFTNMKMMQKKSVQDYEEDVEKLKKEVEEAYDDYTTKKHRLNVAMEDLKVRLYLDLMDFLGEQGYDLNEVQQWIPANDKYNSRWDILDEFNEDVKKGS